MTETPETPTHWPVGKVATQHGNWYEFGDERFLSVTSAISSVAKDALKFWSALLAARGAFARLPELVSSMLIRPCGNSYNRCYEKHGRDNTCERCPCLRCQACMHKWLAYRHFEESHRRSEEGTELHAVVNQWVLAGADTPFPITHRQPEIVPYLKSFARMVQEYGFGPDCFEFVNLTVINRKHNYAGTADVGLNLMKATGPKAQELLKRLPPFDGRVLGDWKTREGEGKKLYPDQPLQLAAYQRGEVVRLPDGREFVMQPYQYCVVIQLRPDGYDIEPVVTDDRAFAAFLNALQLFQWQIEYATAAISPRTFPPPTKAAKKAPARKATKKATPATQKATTAQSTSNTAEALGLDKKPLDTLSDGTPIPF